MKTIECMKVQDMIILMTTGVSQFRELQTLADEKFGRNSTHYEYASGMVKAAEDMREAFNKLRKTKTIKVRAK